MNTIDIYEYSFFEFCQKTQEALKNGYEFDFDKNDGFPTAFGSVFTARMYKTEEVQESQQVQNKPKGPGRPKASA